MLTLRGLPDPATFQGAEPLVAATQIIAFDNAGII